ncbi:MAG: porin [Aquamicrobium sp.]|uniref:porin n=1 Tax=Aquamicrobium sp. TaxID=1872579 RepID=UPI00349EAF37|nr:porin [Aquamicrobium sp.]
MNIKSLILGSATVALATAGAQAADAIVIAEPEPVEYVRVCDVYGAGFFYIPGTETCLKIGGEFRHQIGSSESIGGLTGLGNYHALQDDRWNSTSRVRVVFDARSETEYGTLQGYARLQFDRNDTVSSSNTLNHGWLSLGGFRAGWTDSAWVSTPQGGRAAGGSHSDSGFFYGYHQTHLVQYNFAGSNGFFGTISAEFDDAGITTNYTPDFVGVVGINQGWGAAWLKVGFDEEINVLGDSGFGVTAGLHYNIAGAPGSSFRLLGYYADSANKYSVFNGTGFGPAGINLGGPEWSIMASYYHQFNAQFGASLAVQYFGDLYAGPGSDVSTGIDGWALELNTVWTPVENFVVRGKLVYNQFDLPAGIDDDSVSGFIRFSRFF